MNESPTSDQECSAWDVERTREVLSKLHGLVGSVAHDVGEHRSHVAATSRELEQLLNTGDPLLDSVVLSMQGILRNNERLQHQLSHAEMKLRDQQEKIDIYLEEALTDPLTGLLNRRALDDTLKQQLSQWERMETPFSLLLVDLDHFKSINDTLGHPAGDDLLRGVARVITATLRDMDMASRYGGEEFALVLPGTDLNGARKAGERVRALLAAGTYLAGEDEVQITASVGVATASSPDTPERIVVRADEALYLSKDAGRNCVHWHDGERGRPLTPA